MMSMGPDAAASGVPETGTTAMRDHQATNGVDAPGPPDTANKTPGGSTRPKRQAATNARDLLSGKREREGFFDAEDDARAKAAEKRAAAAAEKERAEEELIARWREEDRLKQAAKIEEKARLKMEQAGGEENGDTKADDKMDVDTAKETDIGKPTDDSTNPREQYDGNGVLIVGTTGRSKKNKNPDAFDEKKLVPPPAPPRPTVAYAPPLAEAHGIPCFGCHECGYSRHGCDVCLKGPKVRSAHQPKSAVHHDVPPVPTYYPTEAEWSGDPLTYINSIRPEAEKYGVCNIVAPGSFQPEFRLPNKQYLRFRTRVQAVNELQNRAAGPSKRARENEAKARAALEAAGLAVPEGFGLSVGGGGRMGGGVAGLSATVPAPSTPPDERTTDEPVALDAPAEGSTELNAADASAPTPNPDETPVTESKLGCSKCRHAQRGCRRCVPGFTTVSDDAKATAILAQYGFIPGERHTVSSLERYSKYFKKKYFSENGRPADVSVRDLEGEFWRLIESPAAENKHPVEVIYGADIATLEVGSGFTSKDDECEDNPSQKKYALSPWNVCNMPYNEQSCLKHVEATTGITVPWLYFGMTLSTFCWHVEDHHFYSVNYHHFGDPKVWYSIPASYSKKFEEVMRRRLPHLFDAQPDLLHSLVTILSPAVLKEEGIPVYRAEQHPRSYIITFPNAYHAGFNTGFNCAEAVNFAPVDWLPFGAQATEQYVTDKRYQSVAHDQLLGTLCDAAETQRSFAPTVAKVMRERVEVEKQRRSVLVPEKVLERKVLKMAGTDDAPDLFEKDCSVCQADLNWAGVRCDCKGKKLLCLRCFAKKEYMSCRCSNDKNVMFVRNSIEELEEKCLRLESLANDYERNGIATACLTVAEEWIACDACSKWRRVDKSIADALGDDDKWTCSENTTRQNFSTCDTPEESWTEKYNEDGSNRATG